MGSDEVGGAELEEGGGGPFCDEVGAALPAEATASGGWYCCVACTPSRSGIEDNWRGMRRTRVLTDTGITSCQMQLNTHTHNAEHSRLTGARAHPVLLTIHVTVFVCRNNSHSVDSYTNYRPLTLVC